MSNQNRWWQEYLTKDLKTYMTEGMGVKLYDQPHDMMCGVYENALPPSPNLFSEARQKYTMTLFPRETLKTTIGCQGLAEFFSLAWKVRYGYDTRTLIIRSAKEASQSVLGAVEQDLSTVNPVLQRAFGNLGIDAPEWSESAATFGWRTTAYREPTFDAASTGASRTGYHYDLIIVDDIANETNYESEVEMAKARRYLTALVPVLNTWGSLLVIGTRWGFNDPYGAILDFNEREIAEGRQPLWDVYNEGYRLTDGNLFYPAWLTEERVQEKRRVMYALTGSDKLWMASYLNVVSTDESAVFKKQEQRFYSGVFSPRTFDSIAELRVRSGNYGGSIIPVECAMHIDPATSISDAANKTGIIVALTDKSKNRWIHDSWDGKEQPADIVSRVVSYARHYVPYTISIDVSGQQVLWVDRLRDALADAGLSDISITEYRGPGVKTLGKGPRQKEKRIESLGLLFREGTIFLREGFTGPIVKALDTYNGVTSTNHFDILDALSHTMGVGRLPRTERYSEDVESFEEDLMEDEPVSRARTTIQMRESPYRSRKRSGWADLAGCPHGLHEGLCLQCKWARQGMVN